MIMMRQISSQENMIFNFSQKKHKGFTLIELLVVVAIIGIVSSISYASLEEGRAKARDIVRVSWIDQISGAMALYELDKGEYPGQGEYTEDQLTYNIHSNCSSDLVDDLQAEGYLQALQVDPRASEEQSCTPLDDEFYFQWSPYQDGLINCIGINNIETQAGADVLKKKFVEVYGTPKVIFCEDEEGCTGIRGADFNYCFDPNVLDMDGTESLDPLGLDITEIIRIQSELFIEDFNFGEIISFSTNTTIVVRESLFDRFLKLVSKSVEAQESKNVPQEYICLQKVIENEDKILAKLIEDAQKELEKRVRLMDKNNDGFISGKEILPHLEQSLKHGLLVERQTLEEAIEHIKKETNWFKDVLLIETEEYLRQIKQMTEASFSLLFAAREKIDPNGDVCVSEKEKTDFFIDNLDRFPTSRKVLDFWSGLASLPEYKCVCDKCSNIDGQQDTVPEGYRQESTTDETFSCIEISSVPLSPSITAGFSCDESGIKTEIRWDPNLRYDADVSQISFQRKGDTEDAEWKDFLDSWPDSGRVSFPVSDNQTTSYRARIIPKGTRALEGLPSDWSNTATVEVRCDVCPNIDGVQQEIPEGYKLVDGQCVEETVDLCSNIEGDQYVVPSGYTPDNHGQCFTPLRPPVLNVDFSACTEDSEAVLPTIRWDVENNTYPIRGIDTLFVDTKDVSGLEFQVLYLDDDGQIVADWQIAENRYYPTGIYQLSGLSLLWGPDSLYRARLKGGRAYEVTRSDWSNIVEISPCE